MLETIAVILVVLWLLGLATSYTMGGAYSWSSGYRDRGYPDSCYSRTTYLTEKNIYLAVRDISLTLWDFIGHQLTTI